MLATFSAKMGRACGVPPLFLSRCFFESIFSAREGGTPSHGAMGYPVLAFILGGFGVCVGVFWPHLGSSLEVVCLHVGTTPSPMGYPILGRFLNPIWCQLGAILGHFGARAGPGWAGGITRSAKNFNVFLLFIKFPYFPSFLIIFLRIHNFFHDFFQNFHLDL